MNKWVIDKQFSFCYGHRVYNQELERNYCERSDYQCKCRHLHGHEGLVHVFLEVKELNRGMVTDFKHLGWVKNFIDDYIDHKFIIDKNDPMFKHFVEKVVDYPLNYKYVLVPDTNHIAGTIIDLEDKHNEILEGYFIVDFVPTSENLSKWIYDCIQAKMSKLNVQVSRIDWFETPKSRSSYQSINR